MPSMDAGNARNGRILGCASQGSGSYDESRLRDLLSGFQARFFALDRKHKVSSFRACLRELHTGDFDLFALEGTGLAAGLAAILAKVLWKRPYVISSGDAVAPFLAGKFPAGAAFFRLYERLLYARCAGFIGWTPYLVGRALTMGARRGVTIPGWAPQLFSAEQRAVLRQATRRTLGIPMDAIVFGLAGSLSWSKRYQFCYGAELVRAAARCSTPPYVLIVGDGSGLSRLRELAGPALNSRVLLPGRVPRAELPGYLAAMDFGSLPQSVDGVGSFRYTTKLPEYRSAGLVTVTNQIPMAYDLDCGDIVRLRGLTPWDEVFLQELAELMQTATVERMPPLEARSPCDDTFDRERQLHRVTAFLSDVIASEHAAVGKGRI